MAENFISPRIRKMRVELGMKQCFPEIFGNDFHKNRIAAAIAEERLPHAFLIDGPEGSGKMTLAKEIAAALNCERQSDVNSPLPCGICNSCRRIRENAFTDVKILSKPSDKATIGVGLIKDFRSDMYLTATESRYKIYIIDEAEKMTTEAQNALLIVLEEPPKNVIIMLLSSGSDAILTTIKSRTQYIAMSRFTAAELSEYLTKTTPEAARMAREDAEGYKALLVSADGIIGRAKALLDPGKKEENKEKRRETLAIISALGAKVPYTTLYEAISALPTKRAEFSEALELLISAIRDLTLAKKTAECNPLFFTDMSEAKEYAKDIPLRRLAKIYDIISDVHDECSKNANTTLLQSKLAAEIKLA